MTDNLWGLVLLRHLAGAGLWALALGHFAGVWRVAASFVRRERLLELPKFVFCGWFISLGTLGLAAEQGPQPDASLSGALCLGGLVMAVLGTPLGIWMWWHLRWHTE